MPCVTHLAVLLPLEYVTLLRNALQLSFGEERELRKVNMMFPRMSGSLSKHSIVGSCVQSPVCHAVL